MRRSAFLVGPGLAGLIVIASCGARTGLDIPIPPDATADASHHREAGVDATRDATRDATQDVFADVIR